MKIKSILNKQRNVCRNLDVIVVSELVIVAKNIKSIVAIKVMKK